MYKVIGVRFKNAGKIYFFDPLDYDLNVGDYVIVETARGVEYGKVASRLKEVEENDVVLPLKKIIRPAQAEDIEQVMENREEAERAFHTGQGKIEEHKLDMKLVDVEYTFDRNKIVFYFTAEGRVDFRNLVKDLASIFRTRIELRQIGVRDEAKMLGESVLVAECSAARRSLAILNRFLSKWQKTRTFRSIHPKFPVYVVVSCVA